MRRLTILAADDDPSNLEILNVILTGEGHRVILSSDAVRAVELAKQAKPDLVLMDAIMPGEFDGLEAVRRLKADPEFRGVIAILSASASGVDRERGLASGADDYMTKPFRRKDLLAFIERLQKRIPAEAKKG